MKVLALIPSFFGSTGDAVNERQLLMALAKRVEKCNIVTFIGFKQLFTRRRKELKVDLPKNITLIALPIPQVNALIMCLAMITTSCLASIISLMLNALKKIDLIYIRNSFLSIGFLTFHSLAKKTLVKIPAIIEDEIPNNGGTKFFIKKTAEILDRLVLAKAGRVGVDSKLLYYELVKRRSLSRKDAPLEIPAGVDLQKIRNVSKTSKPIKERNEFIVGFLGSLFWWQGVDTLVRSVALVRKKLPVRLLIIGDGRQRSIIESLCRELRVPYEITGYLSHEEALQRLTEVDVLVIPSRRHSTRETKIPNKIIEAWSLGIPVVTTKHRVFKYFNIKGDEEVVFCEPIPTDVANAILKVLENKKLRRKLIKLGLQKVKAFTYDEIIKNLLEELF